MYLTILLLLFRFKYAFMSIPPNHPVASTDIQEDIVEDINILKHTTKELAAQLEKWNNLFLTSLEPRISSMAISLANINSNVNNLQQRAHVWDTFQLHVSAWNEQLATLDRKVDIISKSQQTACILDIRNFKRCCCTLISFKNRQNSNIIEKRTYAVLKECRRYVTIACLRGQEKMLSLEAKINSLVSMSHKIDDVHAKLETVEESLSIVKQKVQTQCNQGSSHFLFGEFAGRGILSTVKMIEKKLDRLQQSQQNIVITRNGRERAKLMVKCNTRFVEEILNDMSSKVDVIFDRVNGSEDEEYEIEEYVDGSGENGVPANIQIRRNNSILRKLDKSNITLQELSENIRRIENMSHIILSKENDLLHKIDGCSNNTNFITSFLNKLEENGIQFNENLNKIMDSYFSEQRAHFESSFDKHCIKRGNYNNNQKNIPVTLPTETIQDGPFWEPTMKGCEDLGKNRKSGIYIFGNITDSNPKNRSNSEKYCLIRDDGSWTVLQRRDNFFPQQNFNMSWSHYRSGFGNLLRDFWIGNNFLCKFSLQNELLLRIELEDFDGNTAWAEYSVFKVFSEADDYRLIVGMYRGNASDSLSSHNNTFFSTFDRKNDQAPDCCPCAISFGGGWWFNSCFESNLNGIYHKQPQNNGYYNGIIWEHWLGDYSLKKTLMLAKPIRRFVNTRKIICSQEEANLEYP